MGRLRALGARSVPVVARAGRFVYAQVIKDVIEFLGLSESIGPMLAPAQLADRSDRVLGTALRLVRQMPDALLENELPHRPRSWRVLMHHIFQIHAAFLDAQDTGMRLEYEVLVATVPDGMRTSGDIARFGASVQAHFARWWSKAKDESFSASVATYFGDTSRHEMLERTVWHSAQHTRQLAALLEQSGITPDDPLNAADIDNLPLTAKIWDEG